MRLGPTERVLEMIEIHRGEAELYERRGQDELAKLIRSLTEDYEKILRNALPEWVTIHEAQTAKGWSPRWWRRKCQDLRDEGLARKRGGEWRIRREALERIRRKPQHTEEIDTEQDFRKLAAELAED